MEVRDTVQEAVIKTFPKESPTAATQIVTSPFCSCVTLGQTTFPLFAWVVSFVKWGDSIYTMRIITRIESIKNLCTFNGAWHGVRQNPTVTYYCYIWLQNNWLPRCPHTWGLGCWVAKTPTSLTARKICFCLTFPKFSWPCHLDTPGNREGVSG